MHCASGIVAILCALFTISGCSNSTSNQEKDLRLLALKSKCREDGEKVRSEWKQRYYQDVFSEEPEYSYNQSLNTCLWLGEYRGKSADWLPVPGRSVPKIVSVQTHVQFILDIYTNKTLIEYTEHDGKQIGDVSKADFETDKTRLFGSQ